MHPFLKTSLMSASFFLTSVAACAQTVLVNYARLEKDSVYRTLKENEIAEQADHYFGADFRDMELAGFTTYAATIILDSTGRQAPQLLLQAGKYVVTRDAFGGSIEEYAEVQRSLFDVHRDGHFDVGDRAECRDEILYSVGKDVKQKNTVCESISITSFIASDYGNICIRGSFPSKDGVMQSAVSHGELISSAKFVESFYKTARQMGTGNAAGTTLSAYYQTVQRHMAPLP